MKYIIAVIAALVMIALPQSALGCLDDLDCDYNDECINTDVKAGTKMCLKDYDALVKRKSMEEAFRKKAELLTRQKQVKIGKHKADASKKSVVR